MAGTIAEKFVNLGLVTAEHAEIILQEAAQHSSGQSIENEMPSGKKRKNNKIPGCPGRRTCVACGKDYAYIKRKQYSGKSPKRCPECQVRLSNSGMTNMDARPMGHKTRQQHKRVKPSKK